MKIPWVPFQQGGGAEGPTLAERIFVGADGQPDYGTAKNPIERKAFQNLPMPCRDAMNIYEPNILKGPKNGTALRNKQRALEGAGENYVDSFTTHPTAGNYEKLFAVLDDQKKDAELEKTPQLTLLMIARRGFTNLGLNADDEKNNNLRDRMRFMGLSDDEIETQMKEARQKKIKEMLGRELIPEQREVLATEAWARQMGVLPGEGAPNFGSRPFQDGNVFNFGTPAPADYAGFQTRVGPDNDVFVPGERRSAVHSIEVIPESRSTELVNFKGVNELRLSTSKKTKEDIDKLTSRLQRGGIRSAPEIFPSTKSEREVGELASQIQFLDKRIQSHKEFTAKAKRVYYGQIVPALAKKSAEAKEKYQNVVAQGLASRYKKNAADRIGFVENKLRHAQDILAAIEAGQELRFPRSLIRGKGAPKKGQSEYL
jgi:hypothetical protein